MYTVKQIDRQTEKNKKALSNPIMIRIKSAFRSYSCTRVSRNAFLSIFTTVAKRSLETRQTGIRWAPYKDLQFSKAEHFAWLLLHILAASFLQKCHWTRKGHTHRSTRNARKSSESLVSRITLWDKQGEWNESDIILHYLERTSVQLCEIFIIATFFLFCSVLLTLTFSKVKGNRNTQTTDTANFISEVVLLIDDKVDRKIYIDHADC